MRHVRTLAYVGLPLICALALHAPAQSNKSEIPYKIEFDKAKDVSQMDRSPDGKEEGIFIKVRFSISLDDKNNVVKVSDDYKIVIEENNQKVKEVDVPRAAVAQDLSLMLVIDTGGSMKEHGRMGQAREASAVFLDKLPPKSDCGLILFDREIRERVERTLDRKPLLAKIEAVKPGTGTAYLDAALEGIKMLRDAPRGRDRALVLMTDGIDLNSKKSIQDVIKEAKKERVRVYTIGIGEPGTLAKVSTVLVLDHSGSMTPPAADEDTTPKIEALHLAGYRFVESMSSVGRASIIPFSTTVGTPRPFKDKKDGTDLRMSIGSLKAFGETALFDATYEAVNVLEADGAKGKRAVVAMTDGIDNSSRRRVEEVIERAQQAKVPLYMLGFGRNDELDKTTMETMARETGGKFYHAKNKDALLEIFENLSIQLHGDGIDEVSLEQISKETGGQYYPAKNVSELKFILEQVTKNIQRESYEIVFRSLNQRADGTLREVALKLVRRGSGGADTVLATEVGSYQRRGLVVAEMNHFIYLFLLAGLCGMIALPGLLRRSSA